ncbi:hypothetical protein BYT27DRAFT_6417932 [Phlegmacium glaucopus]|nr:hypothetical protein BYT27DRAFT_6417932 [Phlegmacium glaucopus]
MCSTLLILQPPLSSITRSLTRTLFSLPNIPSFSPFESKVETYNEQKLFPYKARELYAIVSDVASYPQFIPFCIDSRIDLSAQRKAMQEKTLLDAELTVGFLNFKESYVSGVTCIPFRSVEATASSSTPLFKTLSTTWRFRNHSQSPTFKPEDGTDPSDPPGPTLVSFSLAYQFANPIHAGVSSVFFGQVSKLMIQAFEDRCLQVYGSRSLTR